MTPGAPTPLAFTLAAAFAAAGVLVALLALLTVAA